MLVHIILNLVVLMVLQSQVVPLKVIKMVVFPVEKRLFSLMLCIAQKFS